MRTLKIAKGLSLPLEAVTQKFAYLARSGAGKTYTAGKSAEEMLDAGAQIVVLDPVGVWWGLRLDADGKGAGASIPVFGGEQGDVPLGPNHGALVAEVIVEQGISVVLDVSPFTQGELERFVTKFAERFFELKKQAHRRTPVHLFLEEAQTFIPQNPRPEQKRMLGAFERIGKIGRNYGIGISLISQRPQAISKEVLNQTEVLFVGQTVGTHERKALAAWIVDVAGGDKKLVDELPSLPRGTMYLWSPGWLHRFEKVEILKKRTADVSATPTFGAAPIEPRTLAPVDLDKLRDAMKAAVEEMDASDPKALRARIAYLERELAEANDRPPTAPVNIDTNRLTLLADRLHGIAGEATRAADIVLDVVRNAFDDAAGVSPKSTQPRAPRSPSPRNASPKPDRVVPRSAHFDPTAAPPMTPTTLGKCEHAILNVLATRKPSKTTVEQVAILAGYRLSGSFNAALARLRADNLIAGPGSDLEITPAGIREAGPVTPLPKGRDLVAYWQRQLGPAEGRILGVVATHPRGITVEHIADATGYQRSGSFNAALAKLRKLELITRGEPVTAHAAFFEGA